MKAEGVYDLTSQDYSFLKNQVEATEMYAAIIKGQVLQALLDAKDDEEKNKSAKKEKPAKD